MTDFLREITRLKKERFSNRWQIDTVIAVRKYLETNFDQEIRLESLAKTHHTSRFHLLRIFKRYYGMTPNQVLTDIRIKHAKKHLTAGRTVTETCFLVGFSSLGSFSSLFTSKAGMSPSQFRKSQLSRSFISR